MSTYSKKLERIPTTEHKAKVREYLMQYFTHLNELAGLPGPNILQYIDWAKANAFEKASLFEIDKVTMMSQVQQMKPRHWKYATLTKGNINDLVIEPNTLYDLDYCASIMTMKDAVKKFKDNFMMTFSRRRVGNKTIDVFFEIREEIVRRKKELTTPFKHAIYTTDNGQYIYAPYWDTSAMMVVAKIK